MRLPRNRWPFVAAGVVAVAALGAWLMAGDAEGAEAELLATVRRGEFVVTVTTAGELRAQKFVQITAPAGAQAAQIYQMKIASIVPEGTTVKEGDLVAELDRATASTKVSEVSLAVQKAQAVYEHDARFDAQPLQGA